MFSDLTAKHSGEYTCRVSNHAATVNYTSTLSVKGKIEEITFNFIIMCPHF